MSNAIRIAPIPPPQHRDALELIFRDLSPGDRQTQVEAMLDEAAAGQLSLDGLHGAYNGSQLVGAAMAQLLSGRTANVWLPRTCNASPESVAVELLTTLCQWLAESNVRLAQLLLTACSERDAALLQQCGFTYVTDLLYLVCQEERFASTVPDSPLEFEVYAEASYGRLADIVRQTYRQTMDCPQLEGVRAIEDVLESYRATGVFDPQRWFLVRHAGQDVGCLLLADHPRYGNYELVYMGLVPESRGSGWGLQVVRYAQWMAHRASRPRLVLAVDGANAPALRAYAEAGFLAWERRLVYLRVFGAT